MNVVITDEKTGALVAYITDQIGEHETCFAGYT